MRFRVVVIRALDNLRENRAAVHSRVLSENPNPWFRGALFGPTVWVQIRTMTYTIIRTLSGNRDVRYRLASVERLNGPFGPNGPNETSMPH